MRNAEKKYLETGTKITGAEDSRMFGKPCFKIAGKAFLIFYQDCLVCKLHGSSHKEALALEGASLFDPSGKGRPMKEWVQLPYSHSARWSEFAGAARDYVGGFSK